MITANAARCSEVAVPPDRLGLMGKHVAMVAFSGYPAHPARGVRRKRS